MEEVTALGSLGMTLALVLSPPRVGRARMSPALAALPGVVVLLLAGVLGLADVRRAALILWRPILTIACIMVTTSVAHRLRIFDRVTRTVELGARQTPGRAFATVYALGALTAAAFNNDAAILLLTPVVIPLVRRLYPGRPELVVPFAFAVFASAGVAPLCTSNPMNLVVAEHAGLGFNAYAARTVIPVALVGSLVSYAMARLCFRRELADSSAATGIEQGSLPPLHAAQKGVLAVVVGVLVAYPVLSYFGAPVWIAALTGASLVAALGSAHGAVTPRIALHGVAWDILAFLFCIFLTALGLEHVGLTRFIAAAYATASDRSAATFAIVGGMSSLGSALVNNHPMGTLNALAIASLPGDPRWRTLAALVGGDIGPRLLPLGSLAGLLWLDAMRRLGVEVSVGRFLRVGAAVTLPALAASLGILWLEATVG